MVNTLGKFVNKTVHKNIRYTPFSLEDARHFLILYARIASLARPAPTPTRIVCGKKIFARDEDEEIVIKILLTINYEAGEQNCGNKIKLH